MMRVVGRARMALLVCGTALVALLAPGAALAHESARHAGDGQIGWGNVGEAGFTAPCPGGSGHVCGCDNLEALAQASEPAAADLPRQIIATIPRAPAKRASAAARTSPLLSLSSARPRAPPQAV